VVIAVGLTIVKPFYKCFVSIGLLHLGKEMLLEYNYVYGNVFAPVFWKGIRQ
jgi:hypothetical protein